MEATAGMEEGLYESLITTNSSRALSLITGLVADVGGVDEAEQPAVLARHVRDAVVRRLSSTSNEQVRIDLVNQLLTVLQLPDDAVDGNVRQLLSLSRPPAPGVVAMSTVRPSTPLSDAALLTNAHGEPSFGSELRSELDTADGVDLLCAFLKWQGIRVISAELERLRERGVPLRIITTTYIGATERLAIERLIDFGATVKINYDTLGTRLHAKAWLFTRRTDFDTAYVGSSNLSKQALLEGLEWNVRLSKVATPSLMEKFQATFETYWHNDSFETYDPERDRDRLDDALTEASGRSPSKITVLLSGLEVRPYPYQVEMLEALEVEREVHGRRRNLIVAATGTGKTVVAALDYKALSEATTTTRPSLLFVAHRQEILRQAMQMYREVLGDGNFGELYVDGHRPERWQQVFASVQSLHSYGVQQIPADAFDIVVIDEFHHAEAKTYRDLLDHLAPHELIGMTATPERTDGSDVRAFFDGRTAYELRLWDALDQGLLCPFHYFGVADGTDLSRIQWTRGSTTPPRSPAFTPERRPSAHHPQATASRRGAHQWRRDDRSPLHQLHIGLVGDVGGIPDPVPSYLNCVRQVINREWLSDIRLREALDREGTILQLSTIVHQSGHRLFGQVVAVPTIHLHAADNGPWTNVLDGKRARTGPDIDGSPETSPFRIVLSH